MSFDEYWEKWISLFRAKAITLTRDIDDRDDLLSVVYIKAKLNYRKSEPKEFQCWVLRIMRNAWIDVCRARARTIPMGISFDRCWGEAKDDSYSTARRKDVKPDEWLSDDGAESDATASAILASQILEKVECPRYREALLLISEGVPKCEAYALAGIHKTTASRRRLALIRGLSA